jgi:hypothetical protein
MMASACRAEEEVGVTCGTNGREEERKVRRKETTRKTETYLD